jgi:hypothetical protein
MKIFTRTCFFYSHFKHLKGKSKGIGFLEFALVAENTGQ